MTLVWIRVFFLFFLISSSLFCNHVFVRELLSLICHWQSITWVKKFPWIYNVSTLISGIGFHGQGKSFFSLSFLIKKLMEQGNTKSEPLHILISIQRLHSMVPYIMTKLDPLYPTFHLTLLFGFRSSPSYFSTSLFYSIYLSIYIQFLLYIIQQ